MKTVLIIGYGNTLRGDDGVGRYAAQHLADTICCEDVEVIECHQLTPELAEPVSQAEVAIFIDVTCQGRPGRIVCEPVTARPSAPESFTHHVDPQGLIESAESLFGAASKAWLITVAGESFELGEQLSPPVRAALPALYDLVGQLVEEASHARILHR